MTSYHIISCHILSYHNIILYHSILLHDASCHSIGKFKFHSISNKTESFHVFKLKSSQIQRINLLQSDKDGYGTRCKARCRYTRSWSVDSYLKAGEAWIKKWKSLMFAKICQNPWKSQWFAMMFNVHPFIKHTDPPFLPKIKASGDGREPDIKHLEVLWLPVKKRNSEHDFLAWCTSTLEGKLRHVWMCFLTTVL